ncbi:Cas10/Cmr2 second palm domain-containing protein [Oribacterium sp. FC2011]|uniref:Cas10/Cmr2 second palm domain-containing protein n=1 Tax=Oribacterium sp. FC2011 TaxID=1408311 RepID=UPI0004E0DD77|nr:hypothetical protein [Oribacterium sp. FC2011]
MASKYLVILEVSQKQAYIFSSNKLRKNIEASAVIAHVTSPEFFKEVAKNDYADKNLVYSGGGHTVLIFENEESAKEFISIVTKAAMERYPGLELFGTYLDADGEPKDKLLELSQKLEKKKSIRSASFHQGSFGIEKINTENNSVEPITVNGKNIDISIPEEEIIDKELSPKGFRRAFEFERLTVKDGDNSFIAVVHIDGNSMGKRTIQIMEKIGSDWASAKDKLDKFSTSIDTDFKNSFKEMCEEIAEHISPEGKLGKLQLQEVEDKGMFYFPVKRIITAGDDICFVTEGHLGLECARIFIEKLSTKKNSVDGEGYSACAGVAIVHKKYPFYKAYELSELLCSNAKKYISTVAGPDAAAGNSAIDWHIEYGELSDTLDEVRHDYLCDDGSRMELRPYIVCGDDSVIKEDPSRDYKYFKKTICSIQDGNIGYASGKIKGLRNAIKQGEKSTYTYLKKNLMNELALDAYQGTYTKPEIKGIGIGEGLERKVVIETADGVKRSILFDAIEMIDTFIPINPLEA